MTPNVSRDPAPTPSTDSAPSRGRDARKSAHYDHTAPTDKSTATFHLRNSLIDLAKSPVGPVARIERPGESAEYAGPVDAATRDALAEVSEG